MSGMKEQDKKFLQEIILTLLSSAGVVLIYWFQGMDDAERQLIIDRVKQRMRPKQRADKFKMEILKFRAEISAWEHEQRRNHLFWEFSSYG